MTTESTSMDTEPTRDKALLNLDLEDDDEDMADVVPTKWVPPKTADSSNTNDKNIDAPITTNASGMPAKKIKVLVPPTPEPVAKVSEEIDGSPEEVITSSPAAAPIIAKIKIRTTTENGSPAPVPVTKNVSNMLNSFSYGSGSDKKPMDLDADSAHEKLTENAPLPGDEGEGDGTSSNSRPTRKRQRRIDLDEEDDDVYMDGSSEDDDDDFEESDEDAYEENKKKKKLPPVPKRSANSARSSRASSPKFKRLKKRNFGSSDEKPRAPKVEVITPPPAPRPPPQPLPESMKPALDELIGIFPNRPRQLLEALLRVNDGSVEKTAEILMNDGTGVSRSTVRAMNPAAKAASTTTSVAATTPVPAPAPAPVAAPAPIATIDLTASNSTTVSPSTSTDDFSFALPNRNKARRGPAAASRPPAQPKPVRTATVRPKREAAPKKKSRKVDESEDDYGDEISSEEDSLSDSDGSGGSDYEVNYFQQQKQLRALDFFNTADSQQFQDATLCTPEQAALIITLRPFADLPDLRTKLSDNKGVSTRLLDSYDEVMDGYKAVDRLIAECERVGQEVVKVVKDWHVNTKDVDKKQQQSALRVDALKNAGEGDSGSSVDTLNDDAGLHLVDLDDHLHLNAAAVGADGNQIIENEKGLIVRQPSIVNPELTLKSYQLLGISWLNLLYKKRLSGILADEMGLGKTAQVITFLGYLKMTEREKGMHLIVVPSSTIDNWVREFEHWCPSLHVRTYYGGQAERQEMQYELRDEAANGEIDVLITTYNLATGDADRKFLTKMRPVSLILDEGHMVKNASSARHKQLMRIQAPFRLLMTGTPLQNNLTELMALLSFILPDLFGSDVEVAVQRIFSGKGATRQGSSNFLSKTRIMRAKKIMRPFILRRKKADVLKELPKKYERIEFCDATPSQKQRYEQIIAESRRNFQESHKALAAAAAAKPAEPKEVEEISPVKRGRAKKKTLIDEIKEVERARRDAVTTEKKQLSNILMQMRKMSDHPLLFRHHYDDETIRKMARAVTKELDWASSTVEENVAELSLRSDYEIHQLCLYYPSLVPFQLTQDKWMDSGKVQKLAELLPQLKQNGDRILIFSQFTKMLDILEAALRTFGYRFIRMDGQTPVQERQALIDSYNDNPEIFIFLLSTRAGGFGINLATSNVVILYDIDFNPHNDAQAEDRAHRVGQTRDVTVIKLLLKNSIEEHILKMANSKLKLDKSLAEEPGVTSVLDGEDEDKSKRKKAGGKKAKVEEEEVVEGGANEAKLMDMIRSEWLGKAEEETVADKVEEVKAETKEEAKAEAKEVVKEETVADKVEEMKEEVVADQMEVVKEEEVVANKAEEAKEELVAEKVEVKDEN